jgi:hypothetical protein
MDDVHAQWRKELIEAGLLRPDEEIDEIELAQRWQGLQVKKLKSAMSGDGDGYDPMASIAALGDSLGLVTVDATEATPDEDATNPRKGIQMALDALLTHAKGASYCMIVVDRAWINFRYKRNKDNLHLQVAGNKYIAPMELSDSDIKHLQELGIYPEEGSDEIYASDFGSDRNLGNIVDTIFEIFNDVYHVDISDDAYVELDLGKGDSDTVRNQIAKHFRRRDGKKFKWAWK